MCKFIYLLKIDKFYSFVKKNKQPTCSQNYIKILPQKLGWVLALFLAFLFDTEI